MIAGMEGAELYLLIGLMIALGLAGGFVAGLLGVGGGTVFVPGLYYVFKHLGYPEDELMLLSVGTSLAIIIPTGISSARAHHKKGAFSFDLVKKIGLGILMGVGIGTYLADYLGGFALQVIFAVCIFLVAILVLIDTKRFSLGSELPHSPWPTFAGMFNGTISTVMGIGGGMLNVPYMTLYGVPVHKAVGCAAALGVLVAGPGALGFILIGQDGHDLPPLSLGYVNLIAAGCIIPLSVFAAPWGARLAHYFSVKALKRVFAIYLVFVGLKMTLDILNV